MTARETARIVAAFEAAGVDVWVAGGWGVDALLGRQTRSHEDLDLICEQDPGNEARAGDVLAGLGYRPVEAPAGALFLERRIVVRGGHGRTVDLHPVVIDDPAGGHPPVYHRTAFTTGRVGGRAVPCLSAAAQLELHAGYESRRQDRRDVQRLCARFGLPVPPGYG